MHMCMGKVSLWGIEFRVQGAWAGGRVRGQGARYKVQDAGCRVQGPSGMQGELAML